MVKKGAACSTVTAVPDTGWTFNGWSASYGSAGGGSSLQFTVPSNADAGGVVVTAHFIPDAHEHNYVEVSGTRTEPSCLTAGVAKYQCSICNAITEKELPALGHQWDGGSVTQQPAPGVTGIKTYTCTRSGCNSGPNGGAAQKTETIAALTATAAPTPTVKPSGPTTPPASVPTNPPVSTTPPAPLPTTTPPAVTTPPAPEPTAAPTPAATEPPAPTELPATDPPPESQPSEAPSAPETPPEPSTGAASGEGTA